MLKNFMFARVMLIIVLVFIATQAVVLMRGKPRQFTEQELKAVAALSTKAISAIASKQAGPRTVGVAHFLNDENDAVTETVRESVAQHTDWQLISEESVVQKFLSDVAEALKNATTLDQIIHAGNRVDMNLVIAGKVRDIKETPTGATRAEALIIAYNLDEGTTIFKETIVAVYTPTLINKVRSSPFLNHPLTRLAAWLIFVALLPFLTSFATIRALEKSSNMASFILILVYTCLDLLVGITLSGGTNGIALAAGLLLCGIYNYRVCERIASKA